MPAAPKDQLCLCMKWEEKFICCLFRSAPKNFNAVVDTLEWYVIKEGDGYIYHYLDDFAVLGPPSC